MTKEELIARIHACTNMGVSNNPFINDFLGLKPDKQEKVAAELADKKISPLVDNRVNSLGLLSCLWPQLEPSQKKEERRKSDVRGVIKTYGIAKVDFISQEEMDFIFTGFDLRTWQWPWEDTQALLKLFSEEKQKEHLRAYVKDYICPLDVEGWKAFLTPMTDEARHEVFRSLDLQDLKRLFIKELFFERLDFFSSFLSEKHLIVILQQLGSDYVYDCIYDLCLGYRRLTKFLQKFSPEYRKEAIRCLRSEQLSLIIDNLIDLNSILELFPESDKHDLLEYLGQEVIKKTFVEDDGGDISFSLVYLFKRLPSQDRIPFIKIFDPVCLRKMDDNWPNIARIINNLAHEKDVIAFFDYVGLGVIESIKSKYSLWRAMQELQQEKRLGFLRLVRQSYPEFLGEKLVKVNNAKKEENVATRVTFESIANLLPEEECSSFFELFIESDLHSLCAEMAESGFRRKLEEYLQTKSASQLASTNKSAEVATREILSPRNSFFPEHEDSQRSGIANAPQEEQVGSEMVLLLPPPNNPQLTPSTSSPAQKESTAVEPAWSRAAPIQSKAPASPSSRNVLLEEFEKLEATITTLAGRCCDAISSYQELYVSLSELQGMLKDYCNSKSTVNIKEMGPLRLIMTTERFLGSFLNEFNLIKKLALIVDYEKAIQELKAHQDLGKYLGILIIATLCLATNVALGLALSTLIGSWTAPGGVVAGFATLVAGTDTGLMITSICCGVVTGIASTYWVSSRFFKPSPIEKALNHVIRDARKVVEEEMNSMNGNDSQHGGCSIL